VEKLTFKDKLLLASIVTTEQARIPELSELIALRPKAEGYTFDAVGTRVELWANRWLDVYNEAILHAPGEAKLRWVADRGKKNCDECLALDGVVKTQSEWIRSGIKPQSPPNEALGCGGWSCGCKFEIVKGSK